MIVGLPLDVANNGGAGNCTYDWGETAECGGLDMRGYWYSTFGLAIAWATKGCFHCHLPTLSVFSDQRGLKKHASTLGETLKRDEHLGPNEMSF